MSRFVLAQAYNVFRSGLGVLGGVLFSVSIYAQSPPQAEVGVNVSWSPSTVAVGDSATFSWSGMNATNCQLYNGTSTSNVSVSGSQTVSNLQSNKTYAVSCQALYPYSTATSASDSATVTVTGSSSGGSSSSSSGGASVTNLTAEFISNQYDVYYGDIDSDGDKDVYLHGKELFILLHGDISIPVIKGAPLSQSIKAYTEVKQMSVPDTGCGVSCGTVDVTYYKYAAPELVSTPLTDSEITSLGLIKLQSGIDYYVGDFNGDGLSDLLVKADAGSNSLHRAAILVEGRANSNGSLAYRYAYQPNGNATHQAYGDYYSQTYPFLKHHNIFDASTQFEVRDVNADGKDELVALGLNKLADTTYDISSLTNSINVVGYITNQSPESASIAGVSQGAFRVDESGAATYTVPIYLPEGTGGVKPSFSISYSSSGQNGTLGLGAELNGLSEISRCRQTLSQDGVAKAITWSSSDRFCFGGNKLRLVSGATYGAVNATYVAELDNHLKISSVGGSLGHPDYFTIESKDGVIKYFGSTSNSKKDRTQGSDKRVLTWHLSRVEDSVGNAVDYSYSQSNADDFYIQSVQYAYGSPLNATAEANALVEFNYAPRVDTDTRYIAGEKYVQNKRLSSIIIKNNVGEGLKEVRRYNMGYRLPSVADESKITRLTFVQECVLSSCVKPTEFEWAISEGVNLTSSPVWTERILEDKSFLHALNPMDVNGDSIMDIAWIEADEHYGNFVPNIRYAIFNPKTKKFDRMPFVGPRIAEKSDHPDSEYELEFWEDPRTSGAYSTIRSLDYNNDGRQDLAFYKTTNNDGWRIFLSVPLDNAKWRISTTDFDNDGRPGISIPSSVSSYNAVFTDVNSDGLTDIVTKTGIYYLTKTDNDPTSQTPYSYTTRTNMGWPSYESWFPERLGGSIVSTCDPDKISTSYFESISNPGDFNGDGKVDFVAHVTKQQVCQVNMGGSGYPTATESRSFIAAVGETHYENLAFIQHNSGAVPSHDLWAQDINADGLTDIAYRAGGKIYFSLNTGEELLPAVYVADASSSSNYKYDIFWSDINADNFGDLVVYPRNGGTMRAYIWDNGAQMFSSGKALNDFSVGTFADKRMPQHTLADFTGDNHMDYVLFSDHTQHLYFFENQTTGLHNVVTKITNGLGAITDINYELLTVTDHYGRIADESTSITEGGEHCSFNMYVGRVICEPSAPSVSFNKNNFYRALNTPFENSLPPGEESFLDAFQAPVKEYVAPLYIVTSVEGSAPAGAPQTHLDPINHSIVDSANRSVISYFYGNAKVQAGGMGFLGFESIVSMDMQTGVKTETHYRQDWPLIGVPLQTATYTSGGDLLSAEYSKWHIQDNTGAPWSNAWVNMLKSSTVGTSVLNPLQVHVKESEKISYAYKTSVTDPSQLEKISTTTPKIVCVVGNNCPAASEIPKTLQSVKSEQSYDKHGNAIKITNTVSGETETSVQTSYNDYDGDGNYLTQGEGASITFSDGRVRSYAELGRLTHSKSETRRNTETAVIKNSEYAYYASGAHAGLLKQQTLEPGSAMDLYRVTTEHTYDSAGNKLETVTTAKNHVYSRDASLDVQKTANQSRKTKFEYDALSQRYLNKTYNYVNGVYVLVSEVLTRNEYGSPTSTKSGFNNSVAFAEYDKFGREVYTYDNVDDVQNDGVGNWQETEYLFCSVSLNCPTGTAYVVKGTSAAGALSYAYFDVLNRNIRSVTKDVKDRLVYADTEYDSLGRAIRKSEPYFSTASPLYWTETSYDILGRVIKQSFPVVSGSRPSNSISYGYLTKTVTNPKGHTRTENSNELGELAEVIDHLGGRITYEYSVTGDLKTMKAHPTATEQTQDGLTTVVTTLEHDLYGRKTKMVDPDKGTWEYKYNAHGELVWQKDGKGQVTTTRYDELGRSLTRTDFLSNGNVENHTTWYYGGDKGIGAPVDTNTIYAGQAATAVVMTSDASLSDCNAPHAIQCTYPSFDTYGRVDFSVVKNNISGVLETYESTTLYDHIGRVEAETDVLDDLLTSSMAGHNTYTGGKIQSGVAYTYTNGYRVAVSDLMTGKEVYRLLDTNARGQVVSDRRSNNLTTSYIYDDAEGRLLQQIANNGLYSFQDITYDWDDLGNLNYRHNQSQKNATGSKNNLKESFCYDALNRLVKTNHNTISTTTCASLAESSQDMRYYSNGNIRYKSDVGTYSYSKVNAGPHAVTATSDGYTYEYDANGNMVKDYKNSVVDRTFTYTTFDKPSEITRGNHSTKFKYGITRSRFWREDNDNDGVITTTTYLGSVEKITKSNAPNEIQWKRHLGGSAIITITTDTSKNILTGADEYKERYVFNDHLGSIDIIVDQSGGFVQSMSFNPWGQRRNADTWVDEDIANFFNQPIYVAALNEETTRGFTGHEMLDAVGIIHMNGRIYDARIARFLQADPIIQAATNTQSLNRYSYIWNNPLNATDPSGYKIRWQYYRQGLMTVVQIVLTVVATIYGGPAGAAAVAAMFAAYRGEDLGGILRAAAIAYVGAAIGGGGGDLGGWELFQVAMVQGVVGGITSVLSGGKFGHGFVSGVISAYAGQIPGLNRNMFTRVASAAVIGGTTSRISGGKFANGAASAAFAALTTEVVRIASSNTGKTPVETNTDDDASDVPGSTEPDNQTTSKDTTVQKTESNTSSGSTSSCNPINIATGEKYLTFKDYEAAGASRLKFERYYSSYNNEVGTLGANWKSNFDRKLILLGKVSNGAHRVIAERAQGDAVVFTQATAEGNTKSVWQAENNAFEQLVKLENGWQLTLENNTKERYDEQGRLVEVRYLDGNIQTLYYVESGREQGLLKHVSDNFGQSLHFSYDLYKRIARVEATDGTATHFKYDQHSNLVQVIEPDETPETLADNPYKRFHYNDVRFAGAITGITDHTGERIHYMAYDEKGRATLSALGGYAERVDIAFENADSQGIKRSKVKNALGKYTEYAFDANNKPLSIEGLPTETCIASNQGYEYNDKGLITRKQDWNGSFTRYEYNDRGLETLRIEAEGTEQERVTKTTWHKSLRLPVTIEQVGMTTELRYNKQGRLVRKTVKDTTHQLKGLAKLFKRQPQRTWRYEYDERGLLLSVNGPRKDVKDITQFEYDALGNRIAVINALGHKAETLAFNGRGLPTRVKDANATITELAYNNRGWLTEQSLISKNAQGEEQRETTVYSYTGESDYLGEGLVSSITLPNGETQFYEYNAARKLVVQSNNAGERIEYTLDLEGNPIAETVVSAEGDIVRKYQRVYDELNRVLQNIGADGATLAYSYDKAGNLTEVEDALGNKTAKAYDALNRLIRTTDASGDIAQTYDLLNRITSVTDQRGLTTEYAYNGFGEKITQTSPDTGVTHYRYDAAGNLLSKIDARGVETRYVYDVINRVTNVIHPEASEENIHYVYDRRPAVNDDVGRANELTSENLIGRLAYVQDASGETHYAYNHRGQVTQQYYSIDTASYKMAYQYDAVGQLQSVTYPNGRNVNYETDGKGQLANVTTKLLNGEYRQVAGQFKQLPYGPFAGMVYGNGTQLSIKHDQNYRISDITVAANAANDRLYDVSYAYDAVSNITGISNRIAPEASQSFGYDNSHRLIEAKGHFGQVSYQYDGVGNRLSRELNGLTETYGYAENSNRLLQVSSTGSDGRFNQRELEYDAVGNIVNDSKAESAKQLHYGANNRLAKVGIEKVGDAVYRYNAKGQRVSKTVGDVTTHFHYDIADRLVAENQISGSHAKALREFIYAAGQRVAMVDYEQSEQLLFVINDHLGTPQAIFDASNRIAWSNNSTPFGDLQLASADVNQPLRFPGQYADEETGYSYNYFRDYDPSLGRYIQSDPIGLHGGVNTFGYVGGRPVNYYDLYGLAGSFVTYTAQISGPAAHAEAAVIGYVGVSAKDGGIVTGIDTVVAGSVHSFGASFGRGLSSGFFFSDVDSFLSSEVLSVDTPLLGVQIYKNKSGVQGIGISGPSLGASASIVGMDGSESVTLSSSRELIVDFKPIIENMEKKLENLRLRLTPKACPVGS